MNSQNFIKTNSCIPDSFTIVTGASSGLGKEFCVQSASMGYNLIMIALPGSNIALFGNHIAQTYQIQVKTFEFDITNRLLLQEKLQLIINHYSINRLINNAGIGGSELMRHASIDQLDRIIQVNIQSMVYITRRLLPHLLKQNKSYIINVASMAAFTPIAYKTVYPASKAFVSAFSMSLREEFRGAGLSVSTVYPGPIMTNSNTSERIISHGFISKLGLLSTTDIVQTTLRKSLFNKGKIIPGWFNKLNYFLLKILPINYSVHIVSNSVFKELIIKTSK